MRNTVMFLVSLPVAAFAQVGEDTQFTVSQVDQGYVVDDPIVIEEEVIDASSDQSERPIVILNKQSSESRSSNDTGISQQPTTVVQANPIVDSSADQMRRKRQDMELQTELSIVEKLEESRIRDEQRRADALFGDRFETINNNGSGTVNQIQQVQQPPQQVVPVQAAPAPTVDVGQEVRKALQEIETEVEPKKVTQQHMGVSFGFSEYTDVINVRTDLNLGVTIGMDEGNLRTEGFFNYGQFDIENVMTDPRAPQITGVDQYGAGGSIKYLIGENMLRPFVGGSVAYTYRAYEDKQYYFVRESATSHAIDVAPALGLDVELSKEFSFVLEYRYFMNVYNRVSSDQSQFQQSFVNPLPTFGEPLEELDYSILSFAARFNF